MVIVAGLWELGWNTPIKEMDLWEYALKEFSVDAFVMSPVTGIFNSYVTECADLGVCIAEKRAAGFTIIFLTEAGSTNLRDFQHPVGDVMYVLGKASLDTRAAYGKVGDTSVHIPTQTNQGGFWPHQAVSIVLYDRFMKQR